MITAFLAMVLVIMIVRPVFPGVSVCMFALVLLVSVLVAVPVQVFMRVGMFVFMAAGHVVMFMLVPMLVNVLVLVLVRVFMFAFQGSSPFRAIRAQSPVFSSNSIL
jgi:hypothetical protein